MSKVIDSYVVLLDEPECGGCGAPATAVIVYDMDDDTVVHVFVCDAHDKPLAVGTEAGG